MLCVKREGRRAAGDHARHLQAGCLELGAEGAHGVHHRLPFGQALGRVVVVKVAVVKMQPGRLDAGQLVDQLVNEKWYNVSELTSGMYIFQSSDFRILKIAVQ